MHTLPQGTLAAVLWNSARGRFCTDTACSLQCACSTGNYTFRRSIIAAAGPSVALSANPFQTNASRVTAATWGTAGHRVPEHARGARHPCALHPSHQLQRQLPAACLPGPSGFPSADSLSQQPSAAGCAAFGQTKPVLTPLGGVAAAGVSSDPFLSGAATGPFPAGSSSTSPFSQPHIDISPERTCPAHTAPLRLFCLNRIITVHCKIDRLMRQTPDEN